MAHLTSVNTGTTANDGTGSTIKAAFDIVNTNTDTLNKQLNGTASQSNATPVTYITATNDVTANTGSIYGLAIYGGVVFSRGSEVLTSTSGSWNGGTVSQIIATSNTSISANTTSGALTVAGGVGIGGNVNIGGNTNIGSALTAGATTVGSLSVAGNATVNGLTVAGTTNFIGNLTINIASGTLNANVVTANVFSGNGASITYTNASALSIGTVPSARVSGAYTGITGLGTLTGLTTGGLTSTGNTIVNSTLYAQGVYDNGVRAVSTSSGSGNLTVSGTGVNLTTHGPGATTVGGTTAIPVITTDTFGRVTALTTASISTTLGVTGTTGTGTVALASQSLTFAGSYGVTATASSQTVTISTSQDLRSTASPTFAGLTVPSITHSGTSGTGDIGASGAAFGTVWATATTAKYADLAENYLADADYVPGTVLMIGGSAEVTVATEATTRLAGVVSTDPAYLMNSHLSGTHVVAVALQGRVPVQVTGRIERGDMLVSAGDGLARAEANPAMGTVIGKALEAFDGAFGTIEVIVGRL